MPDLKEFENKAGAAELVTISLAEHFTRSEKFRELFAHGMELVEDTAAFLDTDGREAARDLPRKIQTLYGTESMRLTTRLMQLASWLLLQRSVADGEMSLDQAIAEKKNVKLNQLSSHLEGDDLDQLPARFLELAEASLALQRRIIRLDHEIYEQDKSESSGDVNPVGTQQSLLETAFDPRYRVQAG